MYNNKISHSKRSSEIKVHTHLEHKQSFCQGDNSAFKTVELLFNEHYYFPFQIFSFISL